MQYRVIALSLNAKPNLLPFSPIFSDIAQLVIPVGVSLIGLALLAAVSFGVRLWWGWHTANPRVWGQGGTGSEFHLPPLW